MGRPQEQAPVDSPLPSSPPPSATSSSPSQFQFMDSLKKLSSRHSISIFQKIPPYKRLIGRDEEAIESRKEKLRDMRHSIAKSKSGLWGPTHSFDSDDDGNDNNNDVDERNDKNVNTGAATNTGNGIGKKTLGERSATGEATNATQEESYGSSCYDFGGGGERCGPSPATQMSSKKRVFAMSEDNHDGPGRSKNTKNTKNAVSNKASANASAKDKSPSRSQCNADAKANTPLSPFQCTSSGENQGLLKGLWNTATAAVNELFSGECSVNGACHQCQGSERFKYNPLHPHCNTNTNGRGSSPHQRNSNNNNREKKIYSSTSKRWSSSTKELGKAGGKSSGKSSATLGIERLTPPSHEISFEKQKSNASSLTDGIMHNYTNRRLKHGQQSKRRQMQGGDEETHGYGQEECGDDDARAAAKLMAEVAKKSPTPPGAPQVEGPAGKHKNSNSPEATTKNHKNQSAPFPIISIDSSVPFQKSISELTMRSVYGEAIAPVSDMRRMAYYAVGKNHGQMRGSGSRSGNGSGSNGAMNGGNRKCYFTGEPVIGGRPFYAGCVQQGLRTLIVFCLPSALGLPRREDLEKVTEMEMSTPQQMIAGQRSTDELSRRTLTGLSTAALSQHDSIYNDEGFVLSELFHSTAWTEDENGNLCESLNADFLLQALPDPDRDLLLNMQKTFPEQFASLSPQLRRPHCWRLYVKFCFFSGLPIADGEMYYKVLDEVVTANSKKNKMIDEITLSHEVMEAVSGESAEILTLPGNKTFQYLQKHYKQQCAKLTPQKLYKKVFDRSSWVRVMPEV